MLYAKIGFSMRYLNIKLGTICNKFINKACDLILRFIESMNHNPTRRLFGHRHHPIKMTEVSVSRSSVIRKGHPKVPSLKQMSGELAKGNDNTTLRFHTFRVCINTIVLTKSNVNKSALIG